MCFFNADAKLSLSKKLITILVLNMINYILINHGFIKIYSQSNGKNNEEKH